MTKQIFSICCAIVLLAGLVGCTTSTGNTSIPASAPTHDLSDGGLVEAEYGSYVVPPGWFAFEEWSTPEKTYYVEAWEPGHSTSNITVEYGVNRYALEDHQLFARAIMQQLGASGGQVSGSGSYTPAGDVLYEFIIEDEEAKTIQYYVVKDYGFVLIHATHWLNELMPSFEEVAHDMAHSFLWAE